MIGAMRRIVAPAQLELIAGFFDWNGFPPRSPRAVIFGQYQLADIDLLPISRKRL